MRVELWRDGDGEHPLARPPPSSASLPHLHCLSHVAHVHQVPAGVHFVDGTGCNIPVG